MQSQNAGSRKVCCVGFQKTGTTSLAVALTRLGFGVGSSIPRILSEVPFDTADPASDIKRITREVLDGVDAIQDSPCAKLYRELDDWFPGSKFILTVRPEDEWYQSMVKYFKNDKTNVIRRWMYGVDSIVRNEEAFKKVYRDTNNAIIDYFSQRPDDFALMDLRKSGWYELVNFLGPEFLPPFPHANKAGERKRKRDATPSLAAN